MLTIINLYYYSFNWDQSYTIIVSSFGQEIVCKFEEHWEIVEHSYKNKTISPTNALFY